MKPSLNEILERILMWKVDVESGYNDGWTKKHYRGYLRRIREALGPEPKKEKIDIPSDPGLQRDDEFGF